jgi:hypothetical protein
MQAERQCNRNVTGVSISLGTGQTLVPAGQMADSGKACVDSCSEYQLLFENLDVSSFVSYTGGALKLQGAATPAAGGAGGNHCGTGNLRIIFTLTYDENDTRPAQ